MTLFAITNCHWHWPICWLICFILFLRRSFPYWLWRRVIPYTWFRLRAHSGYNWSAEDAYSSMATDPTLAFVGGSYYPALDFVCTVWIMITFYTMLTSLFCILTTEHVSLQVENLYPKCTCRLVYIPLWIYERSKVRYWLTRRPVLKCVTLLGLWEQTLADAPHIVLRDIKKLSFIVVR
jgi:hypothetical protein